jgi:hypothetical protein
MKGRLGFVVCAALALACANDELPPPVGGSSSGTGSTDDTTTGGTGTEETGTEETGASEECKACWAGACDAEIDACVPDDVCACWLSCDSGQDCGCGQSDLLDDLWLCIVDATLDACVDICDAHCVACEIENCQSQFDQCMADQVCTCQFHCPSEDQACQDACGSESQLLDDLADCFYVAGTGPCVAACSD